jgi:SAM-dependent methyltransferase
MKYDYFFRVSQLKRRRSLYSSAILYRKLLYGIKFSNALEIGPGFGAFAQFCRSRNIEYCGIEENATCSVELRKQGIKIVGGSVQDVGEDLGRFDLVFMAHVLEHLGPHQQASEVLSKLLRLLEPNGHIVLIFPDIRWSPRQFFGDYTHTFPTSLLTVRSLCMDLNTTIVKSGNFVGHWLRCWTPLWLMHKLLPVWLLPDRIASEVDCLFMTNGYCIARRV